MAIILKKTKKIEGEIDEFLDKVLQGSLVFREGVKSYLKRDYYNFENKIKETDVLEKAADDLRRLVEAKLYMHTLIPEQRGDVLGLLESTDKVMNLINECLTQFSVETPSIDENLSDSFIDLTNASMLSVENMVYAIRSYFKELNMVRDYITKVTFYEKESDKLSDKIKRSVFADQEMELSTKMHIRYFAYHIERIADTAEDVCDRLSIAVIKRYV